MPNLKFDHEGLSESIQHSKNKFNAKKPQKPVDYGVAILELGHAFAQTFLSIACELQRLNDREEAKAARRWWK